MKFELDITSLIEVHGPFKKEIIIPENVDYIMSGAIRHIKEVEKLVIQDAVTVIETQGVFDCPNLKEVIIGKGIEEIEKKAFDRCKQLKTVVINRKKGKVKIHPSAFPSQTEILFEGTAPESSGQKGRYDISLKELRKTCTVTSRNTGYSINDFAKDGRIRWVMNNGKSEHVFAEWVTDKKIFIPDTIDGKNIGHVAFKSIPDDAVIVCSDTQFGKLNKLQKAATAVGYLLTPEIFGDDEAERIRDYITKNPEMLIPQISECDAIQMQEFFSLIKPDFKLLNNLAQVFNDKVEVKALILEELNRLPVKKNKSEDLSLDGKKKPTVADWKKIWNYAQYKGMVNSLTGEDYDGNCIELIKYLGNESSITIPSFIGKTPVLGIAQGALPAEVKYVSFEPRDNWIELGCSFRFCTEMADDHGYIIIHLGERILMCSYVGDIDLEVLDIPENVTEIHKRAFYRGSESFPDTGYQFRKVIMHEGLQIIGYESFYNCPKLETVELPASLKKMVAYPFAHCPNLKYIRVSGKAEDVSYLKVFSNKNVIIQSSKGSAAEEYAAKNNIPFEAE